MSQVISNAVKSKKKSSSQAKLKKNSAKSVTLSPDELIKKYIPYAASIANTVAQGLPQDVVDFEELNCNARLGLLEAARRFDPQYKVDFKTFSYYRIRGAIFDGLRKTGWLPRSLYSKLKFEQAANDYLQTVSESQDKGSEENKGQLKETVNSLASIYIISLDANEEPMEIEDKKANNIEQNAEFQKIKIHMRQAIEELPDKERKLIKMYYFQNKTLEDAGQQLGLSKSWTSRLHARALGLLFKKISLIQIKAQRHYQEDAAFQFQAC